MSVCVNYRIRPLHSSGSVFMLYVEKHVYFAELVTGKVEKGTDFVLICECWLRKCLKVQY